MKTLTILELMRLTKIELTILEAKIALDLPELPDESPERSIALTNLRRIQKVQIMLLLTPGCR